VEVSLGACRFVAPLKALVAAGKGGLLDRGLAGDDGQCNRHRTLRSLMSCTGRNSPGRIEEVLRSLDLVRYLDSAAVAGHVELLVDRLIASVSGWWHETRRVAPGVTDDALARLRAPLPRSKPYALGGECGHAILVEPWRVLRPPQAVDAVLERV
jgi:hypothetical protein